MYIDAYARNIGLIPWDCQKAPNLARLGYKVLRGCRLYPDSHLGHSIMYVVVFMAAQSSKDGRLGGSPHNSYAGRHPEKRLVQGGTACPSVVNSPEGRRADGE